MTKPDDSTLTYADRQIIEDRAKRLLDAANAWNRFPTPVDDILAAAKVKVAPTSIFDPVAIIAYLKGKTADAAICVKTAISKIFGIYDSYENLIHIDGTVIDTKQRFLKLHETAHHDIPTHKKTYRLFEDCNMTLDPQTADQFEREANNFARYALFQGDSYSKMAADCQLTLSAARELGKKFGASVYASAREFARTNHRACVVYILESIEYVDGHGAQAFVRRIEASASYIEQFGVPNDTVITLDHALGQVLPIGRKIERSTSISIHDMNGLKHDCIAESFDTTHNIIILLYPVSSLGRTRIMLPTDVRISAA